MKNRDSDNILLRTYIDSCTALKSVMMPNGIRAQLGAYSSFTVEWNGLANVFGSIQQLYFYGQSSYTTISNDFYTKKILDGGRTMGIKGSFLVGVRTASGSGEYSYYPMDTYLEMYVNGGYWWP